MKKHILIFVFFFIITIISAILIGQVKTNYDLSIYLPENSKTSQGLEIFETEFGTHTMIQVMLEDVETADVITAKSILSDIDHVEEVLWLDDYVDLNTVPINFIPEETLSNFYVDQNALITVVLDVDTYSILIDQVREDIETNLNDYMISLRGDALIEMANRNIASHETFKIMVIIVPIVLLILFVTSKSWFDPVIALISLGIAVVLNLGTNALLPNISFITQTLALALQLALSIDYTLFFLHRYHEERRKLSPTEAMHQAYKKTLPAITASALTTIAGFLALLMMQYKIGFDIGIVMSKGIILSYIVVLTLIPLVTLYTDKILIKWQHKPLLVTPKSLLRYIFKLKYVLIILFIGLIVFGVYYQSKATYTYGQNQSISEESDVAIDQENIGQYFEQYKQMIILVPNNQIQNEIALVTALQTNQHIKSIDTLITHVDPMISRDLLDPVLVRSYVGESYTRIILNTDILIENGEMYQFADNIDQMISSIYGNEYYVIGFASTASEIEDITTSDHLKVMIISMIAIFVILAVTFRNPIIPLCLILVIESAIWVNVGLLYLTDIKTLYIGYLVVMSIQLGATIDYAVLLTTRYLEHRKSLNKNEAIKKAYNHTLITILVSALILTAAGFTEGLFSNIDAIKDIGYLLGKGTLISLLFTMIFVPVLLVLLDKLFMKTMIKKASK